MPVPPLAPEILAYYRRDREDDRLRAGHGRLEFLRTRDVLRRVLPTPPASVLDVGGGTGVHARWLVEDGYRVHLIDPVPLHVTRAAALPGVTAAVGDARALAEPDAGYDAVLLLGPLYHLVERAERVRALAEAARVVRPGGTVAAAAISRYSGVHDTLRTGGYTDPAVRAHVDGAAATGVLRDGRPNAGFTTAYFHDPGELPGEFTDAGLRGPGGGAPDRYGLEGAAWLMPGLDDWLDDADRRGVLLDALRTAEREPSLLGVSGHLLAVGHPSAR